ncbi:BRCT domain-containing protein [archaeon]|nr:MAG: BRCT domain-containing protein [archaeon]
MHVLTEKWVEDLSSYRFPRYAHLPLQPSRVLDGKTILLLKCTSPDAAIYKDILTTCGATVFDGVSGITGRQVSYIAIG